MTTDTTTTDAVAIANRTARLEAALVEHVFATLGQVNARRMWRNSPNLKDLVEALTGHDITNPM